ncbi:phage portal protein [Allopontixanthobacter sp.]|uniref:phage portal protein n=1 Tax=Allopontixanthobacter sp. TaxID=2906452 RepID=UPI002AB9A524|nr:phage portal protein [Allopontixanthobacter sp.]MDZ4307551.1 phage portal protein [Allopontixanthobacter sp.]
MNALTKYIAAPLAKALTAMRHSGQPLFLQGLLKRTRFDYAREVGDGLDSSVVTAPVMWVQRALPEATLTVRRKLASGAREDLDSHDLTELVRNPNPFYGDIALWAGTVLSYLVDGNAYWIKVRSGAGKPVELWWVPWWMIEPKAPADGSSFLSHYEYSPGTGYGRMRIDPEDVVHFRHGINPRDMRRGLSPIHGVLREIFADLESSNFVASLLRNMGVPGVVISPKGGAMPAPEDVEATKTWFKEAFGGDNRGGPLVMGAPTDVQAYGFNPQQMNLSEARDVAEERVCACIGVPAAVVGFGAGLQQTKVGATMEEMRKLAWHNGVLPIGRSLADELGRSLLPDFQRGRGSADKLELYWNTDDVLALQEDEDKQTDRKLKEFSAGAITLWDYLTETGRDAEESHRYYLRPIAMIEVPLAQAGKGYSPEPAAALEGETRPQKSLPAPAVKDGHTVCGGCEKETPKDQLVEGRCSACRSEPGTGGSGGGEPGAKEDDHGDHSGHDHGVPAGARRASPAAMQRGEAFVLMLQRQERGLQAGFEKVLMGLFESWGDEARDAAATILRNSGEKVAADKAARAKVVGGFEQKADEDLITRIMALLDNSIWQAELGQSYGAHYLKVAEAVQDAAERAGLGTSLPDPVMRAIVASGGRRAGLIDLDAQTRQAIFDALAEGRAEGEGVEALANRIANHVEGGIWSTPETRARIIARTETKFAQNISTIERGKAAGVTEFMVFDGRLGPGRSLLSHMARNGSIVTAADALVMADAEHPNGTLSFAPHFKL